MPNYYICPNCSKSCATYVDEMQYDAFGASGRLQAYGSDALMSECCDAVISEVDEMNFDDFDSEDFDNLDFDDPADDFIND